LYCCSNRVFGTHSSGVSLAGSADRTIAGGCCTHTHLIQPLQLLLCQVFELDGTELKVVKEVEKPSAFKCGTFGASSLIEQRLATGNFTGQLQIWDLNNTTKPVYEVQAHASIVNQIDGFGGQVR
jgi:hypothetical protein